MCRCPCNVCMCRCPCNVCMCRCPCNVCMCRSPCNVCMCRYSCKCNARVYACATFMQVPCICAYMHMCMHACKCNACVCECNHCIMHMQVCDADAMHDSSELNNPRAWPADLSASEIFQHSATATCNKFLHRNQLTMHCILRRGPRAPAHTRSLAITLQS